MLRRLYISGVGFSPGLGDHSSGRDYISKEHGEFTWETLLDNSEDYLSDNLDIHLTGVFRQLFFEYARIDYKYIRTHSDKELEDFPAYQEGGIPYEFIDMVNSQGYVRMFIERLANPFLLDDYFLEEIKTARFKHSLLYTFSSYSF